jgi:hypothetical protein
MTNNNFEIEFHPMPGNVGNTFNFNSHNGFLFANKIK